MEHEEDKKKKKKKRMCLVFLSLFCEFCMKTRTAYSDMPSVKVITVL